MKVDTVAVIGLGYVGLPLALALSKHFSVTGYDISEKRISALARGEDKMGEIDAETLLSTTMRFTYDGDEIKSKSLYIITVPTPVDVSLKPDLSLVLSACELIGQVMERGAIVTLESTVYPGVTEDVCAVKLEKSSGMKCGSDFFMGYSPERVNPGDSEHTLEKIVKVVAGQTPEVTQVLSELYGKVTTVFVAKDIKTAEAAKVIENAQRDLNIAFVNELALIFHRLGIDTNATLEAAGAKWNFLPFKPGLVGGHCIGVDPYYLTFAAERAGYHPAVILTGRRINDFMGEFVGEQVAKIMIDNNLPKRALVLGITFKENVRDIRNSKSLDVINKLRSSGLEVEVYDPMANDEDVFNEYGIRLFEPSGRYGAIVLLVAHTQFEKWDTAEIEKSLADGGLVADVKGVWGDRKFSPGIKTWRL